MNSRWEIFLVIYLPLHFAAGSFYLSSVVLDGKTDCLNSCMIGLIEDCADQPTLLMSDIFGGAAIALIILAIVLPIIISYRREKPAQTKLFE
jgi:hypothetical protein